MSMQLQRDATSAGVGSDHGVTHVDRPCGGGSAGMVIAENVAVHDHPATNLAADALAALRDVALHDAGDVDRIERR